MAKEERKKIRLFFIGGDHSQFQCLFLFQKSYIKQKAFFFSKGDGRKAVYVVTHTRMGQQLLEEQREDHTDFNIYKNMDLFLDQQKTNVQM